MSSTTTVGATIRAWLAKNPGGAGEREGQMLHGSLSEPVSLSLRQKLGGLCVATLFTPRAP
eukprot:1197186-Alexandrium_andersonii.AAC.1